MKKRIFKLLLLITGLSVIIIGCGNKNEENSTTKDIVKTELTCTLKQTHNDSAEVTTIYVYSYENEENTKLETKVNVVPTKDFTQNKFDSVINEMDKDSTNLTRCGKYTGVTFEKVTNRNNDYTYHFIIDFKAFNKNDVASEDLKFLNNLNKKQEEAKKHLENSGYECN